MATPNIIPSIFTAIDRLTAPAMKMAGSIKMLGASAGVSSVQLARMERAFNGISTKAMQLGVSATAIGLGITVPLGLAVKSAMDFEQQMGNVATLVDTTKEDMGAMGESVLKLAQKIPKPIHDITAALYQVRSAGVEAGNGTNQAFGVLENSGKLAVAGLSTMEEATKAVTSAMVVFKDENLTSAQIANSFFKTVQGGKTKMGELNVAFGRNAGIVATAGVSLEEFNAMTAAMTNTGMQAAQAQAGIAGAITALIKPSSDLQTVYASLGYTGPNAFRDIVKASGGLVNAMQAIDEQGKKMNIGFSDDFREKRAMLTEIMLTGTLHDSYLKLYATQKDGMNTVDAKFNAQNQTGAAMMQRFSSTVTTLGIQIGTLLIPALEGITSVLSPLITGISNFAHSHKKLSGLIVGSIGVIGAFALAVGGVSLAIGTLTKGVALVKMGFTAWNFVCGVSSVATGRLALTGGMLNKSMAELPGFAAGATLAMRGFSGVMGSLITRMNIVVAGLALIYSYKDEIQEFGNGSTTGMYYNQLSGNGNDVKESLKSKYKKDPEGTRKFMQDHPYLNVQGIENDFNEIDREKKLENIYNSQQRQSEDETLKKYGDNGGGQVPAPKMSYQGGYNNNSSQDTQHEISLVIKDGTSGGLAISSQGKSASPIDVRIQRTFSGTNQGGNS